MDFAIYGVHLAFWSTFAITRVVLSVRHDRAAVARSSAPITPRARTAPFSRAVLAVHMFAFGVMYFGIGHAVIPHLVPDRGQRLVGALVVVCGAALMSWSLVYFSSWRFGAKLDEGHQLATGGPFRLLRHPIYLGLNLLALGTALWVPTPIVWAGFALMVLGSDLRARAEERLLEQSFGDVYRAYMSRTKRFVPGIY